MDPKPNPACVPCAIYNQGAIIRPLDIIEPWPRQPGSLTRVSALKKGVHASGCMGTLISARRLVGVQHPPPVPTPPHSSHHIMYMCICESHINGRAAMYSRQRPQGALPWSRQPRPPCPTLPPTPYYYYITVPSAAPRLVALVASPACLVVVPSPVHIVGTQGDRVPLAGRVAVPDAVRPAAGAGLLRVRVKLRARVK